MKAFLILMALFSRIVSAQSGYDFAAFIRADTFLRLGH